MCAASVRNRLTAAGYTLRPNQRRERGTDTTELARLYFDEGYSLACVAENSGMSEEGVRKRLKVAGYTLRTRGGAQNKTSTV
jgi:hypothetical protein